MKKNLAMAYSMSKRAKKMAEGGEAEPAPKDDIPEPNPKSASDFQKGATSGDYDPSIWIKNLKEGLGMADGGRVKGVHEAVLSNPGQSYAGYEAREEHDLRKQGSKEEGISSSGYHSGLSKEQHKRVLSEMRSMPKPHGEYAEGGEVDSEDGVHPMVMKIMMGRAKGYSEGGKVANSDEPEADFMPNEFDDLHLRDDLEEHYTGANSGDELGNSQEDMDREDIIKKIMRSRMKRDRNPVPA